MGPEEGYGGSQFSVNNAENGEKTAELSLEEIESVVGIVDAMPIKNGMRVDTPPPGTLSEVKSKINLENIDDVIQKGVDQLRAERMARIQQDEYNDLQDVLNHINQGNKQEAQPIVPFLERQVRGNKILEDLYEIDIARRVGRLKGNPGYFRREMPKYAELTGEIGDYIADFENANTNLNMVNVGTEWEQDATNDKKVTPQRLRETIISKEGEEVEPVFYSRVCTDMAKMVHLDYQLNEKTIREIAKQPFSADMDVIRSEM